MSALARKLLLVIGVGNPYRRDDAAGLMTARALGKLPCDSIRVIEHGGEGADLLQTWECAERVIIVDAVQSGAEPGTIYRWDAASRPLPSEGFSGSTHHFGLVNAVELARVLRRLPAQLTVYGIEGRDFGAGTSLSPEVQRAVSQVAQQLLKDLDGPGSCAAEDDHVDAR